MLRTFGALTEARRLYERFGFVQVGAESIWSGYGAPIVEQGFEWRRNGLQSGTIRS